MIKRVSLTILYSFIATIVVFIIYIIVIDNINLKIYEYKPTVYRHEIDSLFNHTQGLVRVKSAYKSGNKGSIYFINTDDQSTIVVIESAYYNNIEMDNTDVILVDEIKVSQGKTYSAIVNNSFPLIEQMLNPRKSDFLTIKLEKGSLINRKVWWDDALYFNGDFDYASFGNSQNCSIVTLLESVNNEVMIVKYNNKLYLILQSMKQRSLLEIVNPILLKDVK